MTPRQRWEAVLRGERPDRVPCDYWGTEEITSRLKRDLSCAGDREPGTQDSLIMSPRLFRRFLKPYMGRMIEPLSALGAEPQLPDSLEAPRLGRLAAQHALTFSEVSDIPRTLPDLRGPGTANHDLSVFKAFRITEKFSAQFRRRVFQRLQPHRDGDA
ncbi:MAG: hypothetical protein HY235_16145, partial [Acidobacteria bacterium]|nr:hypothetical protein [Acidobacteriota bacterium]